MKQIKTLFLVTENLEKWLIPFGYWNLEIFNLPSDGMYKALGKGLEHSKTLHFL